MNDANGSYYSAGILINVVGFAGAIGRDVPDGAKYLYNVNFFGGFIVSGLVYWVLCKVFPIPACSDHWMEVGDAVDDVQLAYDGSDVEERTDKLDGDTKMV